MAYFKQSAKLTKTLLQCIFHTEKHMQHLPLESGYTFCDAQTMNQTVLGFLIQLLKLNCQATPTRLCICSIPTICTSDVKCVCIVCTVDSLKIMQHLMQLEFISSFCLMCSQTKLKNLTETKPGRKTAILSYKETVSIQCYP